MARAWGLWRAFLQNFVGFLAVVPVLGGVTLAVVEMFRRYIIGTTFYWGVDAVTYFILSGIFLYFGVTQLKRSHLTVDLLLVMLGQKGHERAANFVTAMATLLSTLFVSGLLYFGLPALTRTMQAGRMTMSLVFPLWPFQAALYVGLLLFWVTLLFQLYNDIRKVAVGEGAWEEDEVQEEL